MDSEEINSVAICDGSYQYIDWTISREHHVRLGGEGFLRELG